jgi:hypothetical protein
MSNLRASCQFHIGFMPVANRKLIGGSSGSKIGIRFEYVIGPYNHGCFLQWRDVVARLKIALEVKAERDFTRLKNGSESATHEFS